MAPTRADLELAIAAYWQTKDKQNTAAAAIQSTAEGKAKAVRGGGQFNPLVNLIARFFIDAGYPVQSIGASGRTTVLPSYFRSTKSWDLAVVHKGILVAAMEMKALGSPSINKNINNRIEEAIGNAVDLTHTYQAHLTGPERPWLGYLMIMEDDETSRKATGPRKSRFETAGEWQDVSLQERFAIAGQRMLDKDHYDAVCYFVSSSDDPGPREPAEALDWRHFCAAIKARIDYLAELGFP